MPAGLRVRASPLVFASMTGDLANVQRLLAAGADASAAAGSQTPLTAALTFGYADVARTLIAAGASASITESTGINLLHWAAITDRPALVPVLIKAGVPINATDENGFTPLMYAATIDFGDTTLLKALIAAGADRNIRNDEGRTPLEQARHYGLAEIGAACDRAAKDQSATHYNTRVDETGKPLLKFLHAEAVLNRVKLEFFRSRSTQEVVSSLAPGQPGALKTRPDGTVLDGHHRLRVLMERGVDIQSLPREIMRKEP